MIKPTVGRIVWYHPCESDSLETNGREPLAAIIVAVWSDTCVNLSVFDIFGTPHDKRSVSLIQNGELRPNQWFCEWMPHQVGQAAKTEELQKQLQAETQADA